MKYLSIKAVCCLIAVMAFLSCNQSEKTEGKSNAMGNNLTEEFKKYPRTDQTRFVLLREGIHLYEEADTLSKKLDKLTFGTRIELSKEALKDSGNFVYNRMLKASIAKKTGYVSSVEISKYPPPSFARDREFYKIGDQRNYVQELTNLGFDVRCEDEECDWVFFPESTIEDVYSIVKVLYPSLMKHIPFYDKPIPVVLDAEERESDLIIRDVKGRNHWSYNTASVYVDLTFLPDSTIAYLSLYFYSSALAQQGITFEKLEGGYRLMAGESDLIENQ